MADQKKQTTETEGGAGIVATPILEPAPAVVRGTGKTFFLHPKDIQIPAAYNPRRFTLPAKQLSAMMDSLLIEGQLQPIGVRPGPDTSDPHPLLAFGYTRHAAAAKITAEGIGPDDGGVFPLECRWMGDADDKSAFIAAIRENNDRTGVSRIDRAHSEKILMDEFGMKQREIAKLLGLSTPTISQDQKLLKLVPKLQRLVHNGQITYDAALELADVDTGEQIEVFRSSMEPVGGVDADQVPVPGKAGTGKEETGKKIPGDEPATKFKPKIQYRSSKVLLQHVHEAFSATQLAEDGWVTGDIKGIVDFWDSLERFLTSSKAPNLGWTKVVKSFEAMLGASSA